MAKENISNTASETEKRKQLAYLRSFVTSHILSGSFPIEALDNAMEIVQNTWNERIVTNEIANAKSAVTKGEPDFLAGLDTPVRQFIWGANLAYIALNPDSRKDWTTSNKPNDLLNSPLWQAVIGSNRVKNEMIQNAVLISGLVDKTETTMQWSEAGSAITHNPLNKEINIDLAYALTNGLEHSRAGVVREVGRSLTTHHFTPEMSKIREEVSNLSSKAEQSELTKDEYKRMTALAKEWELRYLFFKAVDDNVANRYAAVTATQHAQDYPSSLNSMMTSEFPIMQASVDAGKTDAEKAFATLINATRLSFFKNSKLINSQEDLSAAGVDNKMFPKDKSLETLMKTVDSDKSSIAFMQPEIALTRGDRARGANYIAVRATQIEMQRTIMIDALWNEYAKDLAKEILNSFEEEVEQQMENKSQQSQKGQEDKSESKDKDSETKNNNDDNNQSEQNKDSNSSKNGNKQEQSKEEQDASSSEQDASASEQDKNKQSQESKDKSQSSNDKNNSENNNGDEVSVEDVGKMPAVKTPQENPNDAHKNKKDEKNMSEDSNNNNNNDNDNDKNTNDNGEKTDKNGKEKQAETVEDLLKESMDEGEKQKQQEEQLKKRAEEAKQSSSRGDSANNPTLDDLPVGDFSDYNKAIAKLASPIKKAEHIFKKIQEYQKKMVQKKSRSHELIPEGGELSRFDKEKEQARIIKQKTGREMEKSDYERFLKEDDKQENANLDIFVWIDGSGSMLYGDPRPMDSAIQAGMILYEATKKIGVNVHVGLWGNEDPILLASPGDDPISIGERIDSAKNGMNCSTELAPAIEKTAETLSKRSKKPNEKMGYTHMLVISDGDIFDTKETEKVMGAMFDATKMISFDVAVINNRYTEMHKLVDNIKVKNPGRNVGIIQEFDSNKIATGIVDSLLKRVRSCKSMIAKEASIKNQEMKMALRKMQQDR